MYGMFEFPTNPSLDRLVRVRTLGLVAVLCLMLVFPAVVERDSLWPRKQHLAAMSSQSWASDSLEEIQMQPATTTTTSSSSSTAGRYSRCTCLRADPEALRRYCSVKDSGWPARNEELVNHCFDFLVHNAS
jgi:hypothetical protein